MTGRSSKRKLSPEEQRADSSFPNSAAGSAIGRKRVNSRYGVVNSLGIGPNTWIEQNRQVMTVTPESADRIRALSAMNALEGTWNSSDTSPEVYGLNKGEPCFAIQNQFTRIKVSEKGAPYLRAFTSLNNLKEELYDKLAFVGVILQPGAARGDPTSVQMQQFTLDIGGTHEITNTGPDDIVFGPVAITPFPYTKRESEKEDNMNWIPKVRIQGLRPVKMLGRVIQLDTRDVGVALRMLSRIIRDDFQKFVRDTKKPSIDSIRKMVECMMIKTNQTHSAKYIKEVQNWCKIEAYSQIYTYYHDQMIHKSSNELKPFVGQLMRLSLAAIHQCETNDPSLELNNLHDRNVRTNLPVPIGKGGLLNRNDRNDEIESTWIETESFTLDKPINDGYWSHKTGELLRTTQDVLRTKIDSWFHRFFAGYATTPAKSGQSFVLLINP